MPPEEWAALFRLEDLDGEPLPLDRMPAAIALMEQRPAHGKLWITGLDGQRRLLSVTGVPLMASPTELVGMVAMFWQIPTPDDD